MTTDALARYGPRIRAIRPGPEIESIVVNDEGLANEVVLVNGEWVFRFARDSDWARRALAAEIKVLELIRGRLPVRVPEPFYADEGALAYRYLPGEALSRDLIYSLDAGPRRALALQLGEFLRALHELPAEHDPQWFVAHLGGARDLRG